MSESKKRKYKTGTEKRDIKQKKMLAEAAESSLQKRLTNFLSKNIGKSKDSLLNDHLANNSKEDNNFHGIVENSVQPDPNSSHPNSFQDNYQYTDEKNNSAAQDNENLQVQHDQDNCSFIFSQNHHEIAEQNNEIQQAENHCSEDLLTQDIKEFIAPDKSATIQSKLFFLSHHPIQPLKRFRGELPFQIDKLYYRTLPNGDTINRNWLSYSDGLNKIFCPVCMVFSEKTTVFSSGDEDFKHIYQNVKRHELSSNHMNAARCYFNFQQEKNIECFIDKEMKEKRNEKIRLNRLCLHRIIDIIRFIAKQGLAYRGKNESAYKLKEKDIDGKGNFLELVLLLAKYDDILKMYIDTTVEQSKIRKEKNPDSIGRGNLVTFISKTTVNKLLLIIGKEMRTIIANEVKQAQQFTVQVDSTQDISVIEQCAIIVRYVDEKGEVQERLLNVAEVPITTGIALKNKLQGILKDVGLNEENIIGCSFDGAANMSGQYNGLQAHIQNSSPNSIFTWCYAHVLNLVVQDSIQSSIKIKSYFGLLNRVACFISESHKRMELWEKLYKKENRVKRLVKIGDTRWWSKSKSVFNLFGSFENQSNEMYSVLLMVLYQIANSTDFDAKTCSEARSLLENCCKFETILISFFMMRLFSYLTPASKYLQTEGIDLFQACHIVNSAKENINSLFNEFEVIKKKADDFVTHINNLEEIDEVVNVETEFPSLRSRKRKKMVGEMSDDHIVQNPLKKFEIEVYKVVINNAVQSIDKRFESNKKIYEDLSFLDPRNFDKVLELKDDSGELLKLSLNLGVDQKELRKELIDFSKLFRHTKRNTTDQCINKNADKNCVGCVFCCFLTIRRYNMHTCIYTNLYMAYKYLITLSCTQVACERVFSKLKIVKNRLRSLLGEDLLKSLLIMNIENDLLNTIDNEKIIDQLAASSKIYYNLLN